MNKWHDVCEASRTSHTVNTQRNAGSLTLVPSLFCSLKSRGWVFTCDQSVSQQNIFLFSLSPKSNSQFASEPNVISSTKLEDRNTEFKSQVPSWDGHFTCHLDWATGCQVAAHTFSGGFCMSLTCKQMAVNNGESCRLPSTAWGGLVQSVNGLSGTKGCSSPEWGEFSRLMTFHLGRLPSGPTAADGTSTPLVSEQPVASGLKWDMGCADGGLASLSPPQARSL